MQKARSFDSSNSIDASFPTQIMQSLSSLKIQTQVKGFYTKQLVPESFYQKINYESLQCQLSSATISIKKLSIGAEFQTFSLNNLSYVNYIQQTILQLQFRGTSKKNDIPESLFLKFKSKADLKNWDLVLFINFQVILSLGKQRLFQGFSFPSPQTVKKVSQVLANQKQQKLTLNKSESQQTKSQTRNDKNNIDKIIKKLTKVGYDMTKYSKDGFNPHKKRVYVSQDLLNLCWEQQSGADLKMIPFQSIKQIVYEKIGHGVLKHVSKPKKEQHCIIYYVTSQKKTKTIQLGSTPQQTSQFVDQLILLMEYTHQTAK